MEKFDLTPAPNVLIALTRTPMQPLDALCELIDNAIDSFRIAELEGTAVAFPAVVIKLPKPSDIDNGTGTLSVQDNGPGMTAQNAERAIKAGFSGNNPYDSLGLFGMGFNIATGKLGRATTLLTARADAKQAIQVSFDLQELVKNGSYLVPALPVAKPDGLEHGTLVEVKNWWPTGDANSGFVLKLVRYGVKKIRDELGRRYAAILRKNKIRIFVNDEPCTAFEHCAWADDRFVTRHGSQIPAVYRFNQVAGTQKRCSDCYALVSPESAQCPSCSSASFRTIEERIKGWFGIQRFDDEMEYGIDLIRNGRTIRVSEKAAFFEFTDEFKKTIKDYPVDQTYGRIIGEVEINHVPVDFMKQDFQRSSAEWIRAMEFLRGKTSLQPGKTGGETNESPLYMLYQGYRRMRTPGKADLYMGYWDAEEGRPKRISRETERDYYARFLRREPGFYDDSEWFKLVEQADKQPLEELANCPACQNQNLQSMDTCSICGHVLKGKTCLNNECAQVIPESALSCPHCGISQVPIIETPWQCKVCKVSNPPHTETCGACGALQGTDDPLSRDYLTANSSRSDDLSVKGASLELPDGSFTNPPLDINVFIVNAPIRAYGDTKSWPMVSFKDISLDLYLDTSHVLFRTMHVRPEELVATETALFIYDSNRRLTGGRYTRQFTVANLQWLILHKFWPDRLTDTADRVKSDISGFIQQLTDKLPAIFNSAAQSVFQGLEDEHQKQIVTNIINNRKDITKLNEMTVDGSVLSYAAPDAVLSIYQRHPAMFLDGAFWADTLGSQSAVPVTVYEEAKKRIAAYYGNLLEDAVHFLNTPAPSPNQAIRARKSLQLLTERLA